MGKIIYKCGHKNKHSIILDNINTTWDDLFKDSFYLIRVDIESARNSEILNKANRGDKDD